jgi:hypothetical protein
VCADGYPGLCGFVSYSYVCNSSSGTVELSNPSQTLTYVPTGNLSDWRVSNGTGFSPNTVGSSSLLVTVCGPADSDFSPCKEVSFRPIPPATQYGSENDAGYLAALAAGCSESSSSSLSVACNELISNNLYYYLERGNDLYLTKIDNRIVYYSNKISLSTDGSKIGVAPIGDDSDYYGPDEIVDYTFYSQAGATIELLGWDQGTAYNLKEEKCICDPRIIYDYAVIHLTNMPSCNTGTRIIGDLFMNLRLREYECCHDGWCDYACPLVWTESQHFIFYQCCETGNIYFQETHTERIRHYY